MEPDQERDRIVTKTVYPDLLEWAYSELYLMAWEGSRKLAGGRDRKSNEGFDLPGNSSHKLHRRRIVRAKVHKT